jgi:4-amino-4-deoxy-L-arabinose transferase-like glycosyltransferase
MRSRATLIGFVVFLAFAVILQALSGAYAVDFAGNPDEPAHYVTGVMVRDYLAAFPWQPPMTFARNFYSHYPIVAIGHWPPMFYVAQAAWTLPFGLSRLSVLLLMAILSAATATVVFASWQRRFGKAAAGALALAFLSVPIVQEHGRMVMAEMLLALFTLLAVAAYRRYLETGHWRESLQFALAASAAILTKPNGLALALLPIVAVIAVRRVELLKRFSYWLPALVVALLCAPWYALTADLAREGWSASYEPSWLIREPAAENAWHLIHIAGAPVFVLALLGVTYELWPRRGKAVNTDSAMMAALLCSVWLFHSFLVPVRDARHLIPAIPALLGLSASALAAFAGSITTMTSASRRIVLAFGIIAAAAFFFGSVGDPARGMGAEAAVRQVLSQTVSSDAVLVSSESYGEGAIIAKVVEQERRPGHRILRASQVLSSSSWDRSNYRLLHDSATDADAYLKAAHINVLVLDLGSAASRVAVPHHRLLLDVVRLSSRWRRLEPHTTDSRFGIFQAIKP